MKEHVRGHRHLGNLIVHKEERHWAAVPFIVAAVAVAGTAVSVYATVQQQQQQADLQKSLAKQKQTEKQNVLAQAEFEQAQTSRKAALLLGEEQAIFSAGGVDTGSGTSLINELDTVRQAGLENQKIKRQATLSSTGLEFESQVAKYRASIAQGAIPLELAGGVLQATSSGFSAYRAARPNVLTDWYQSQG